MVAEALERPKRRVRCDILDVGSGSVYLTVALARLLTDAAVEGDVRTLRRSCSDSQIAAELSASGCLQLCHSVVGFISSTAVDFCATYFK